MYTQKSKLLQKKNLLFHSKTWSCKLDLSHTNLFTFRDYFINPILYLLKPFEVPSCGQCNCGHLHWRACLLYDKPACHIGGMERGKGEKKRGEWKCLLCAVPAVLGQWQKKSLLSYFAIFGFREEVPPRAVFRVCSPAWNSQLEACLGPQSVNITV